VGYINQIRMGEVTGIGTIGKNGLLWLIWWLLISRGLFRLGRGITEA
jgi:hypothetical protein